MQNTREQLLHRGRDFMNRPGWVTLNNQEIAKKLGIHPEDFEWLFESKWHFEGSVLENYSMQHILNAKTQLSCWFQSPVKKVKKYNQYLIQEFITNSYMLRQLFATLHEGRLTCQGQLSEDFIHQLATIMANCHKDLEFESSSYPYEHAKESLQSFTQSLMEMDKEGLAEKYLGAVYL